MNAVLGGLLLLVWTSLAMSEPSFLDVDSDLRRQTRDLLQAEGEEEAPAQKPPTPPPQEHYYSSEPQKGPNLFYDGENFLMQVHPGIVIYVYENANNKSGAVDKIVLGKPAASVKGGFESEKKNFDVSIDFKGQSFGSDKIQLSSVILKMSFVKNAKEFVLTHMEISQATVGSSNVVNNVLDVSGRSSYPIKAPLGLGFCCDYTGEYKPKSRASSQYSLGVGLPGMKMQVFGVKSTKFGPSWYCGELLSIGVWVGLILSLGFAIICYWGFSMLANIQTMDRFDDPKGKPIHVPLTE